MRRPQWTGTLRIEMPTSFSTLGGQELRFGVGSGRWLPSPKQTTARTLATAERGTSVRVTPLEGAKEELAALTAAPTKTVKMNDESVFSVRSVTRVTGREIR